MSGSRLKFNDAAACEVFHGTKVNPVVEMLTDRLRFKNPVKLRLFDNGKFVMELDTHNIITDVGLDYLLGAGLHGDTPTTTWYIGLIDSGSFSAVDPGDTMASHGGWLEFTTYTESVRQTWAADAPSARAISNSSPAVFSISGTGTLKGIFITSISTKGGTTGTLFAAALFGADVPVTNTSSVQATYTVAG